MPVVDALILTCPKCDAEIPLDETFAAPLVAQAKEEARRAIEAAEAKARKAEEESAKQLEELTKREIEVEFRIAEGIAAKRPEYEAAIQAKLELEAKSDKESLERSMAEIRSRLMESQRAEAEALKAKRDAELKAEAAEVEVQRQVILQLSSVRAEIQKEADEANRLKMAEKDQLIERLKKQAEEMQRKAEVGSQQLQGEVLELDLETVLARAFPQDAIEEVKKGQRGGDCIQRVMANMFGSQGAILWEAKRAQNWSGEWCPKLKADMRACGAQVAVLVSSVTPKEIPLFGCTEDVWVCKPECVIPLAIALRNAVIEVHAARKAGEGKQTKTGLVYDYITGPDFVSKMKGIVEPLFQMHTDLEQERRLMSQRWAKRQKLIERSIESASSLTGAIEGLAGIELAELGDMEMPVLSASNEPDLGL